MLAFTEFTAGYNANVIKVIDDAAYAGLNNLSAAQAFNITEGAPYQSVISAEGGFEIMGEIGEQADVPMFESAQRYTVTKTQQRFVGGFKVTDAMARFDLQNTIQRKAVSLGESASAAYKLLLANIFNRYINSSYLGGDGVVLCSASHTTAGGTARNVTASGSALSASSLSSMRMAMLQTVDHYGKSQPLQLSQIVVPAALADAAMIQSGSLQKPGTTDNDMNVAYGTKVVVVPEISVSSTVWFGQSSQHGLEALIGAPYFSYSVTDPITQAPIYVAGFYATATWSDWRGIYGNAGA